MTRTETKLGFCAVVFALTVVGCSQQGEGVSTVQRRESASQSEATEIKKPEAEKVSSERGTTDGVRTPAQMGFPPEQAAPWVIKVSPEPLSPARSANTGDYRGDWPDYRCPREIFITAPELPPGIEGPTSDTTTGASQASS